MKARGFNVIEWFRYQFRTIRVGAKRGNPLFIGIGATKLFLALVLFLALLPQQEEGDWSWRLWSFFIQPPNEIGDTLAGIAGALAFLWIIVTVMMQSKELAAQREELSLTRKEFTRMAEAQSKQVELLVKQGEIFKDEQKQRMQSRQKELLERRIEGLHDLLVREPHLRLQAKVSKPEGSISQTNGRLLMDIPTDEPSVALPLIAGRLEGVLLDMQRNINEGATYTDWVIDDTRFDEIEHLLNAMLGQAPDLSEADRQRLKNLRVTDILYDLTSIYDLDKRHVIAG